MHMATALKIHCLPAPLLQYLPVDILIKLVAYLPLKDSYNFSRTCTVAFDVVYYAYSHRTILDFTSTLHPSRYINLPDHIILELLHAHTRVTHILSFALPPWFSSASFEQLQMFFKYYLDPNYGGHATGQLHSLQYPYGWDYDDNTRHLRRRIQTLLSHFEGDIISVLDCKTLPPELWSNVDLDEEYRDSFPGALMMSYDCRTNEDEIEEELEYYRNIHMYDPGYHGQNTI